jgi:lysophospholipase L1-like esterase
LDPWHLFAPFWRSPTVYGESLFFCREVEGQPPRARLLFKPAGEPTLRGATGEISYREGHDYLVDAEARTVILTEGSPIPFTERRALYRSTGQDQGIPHRTGDPSVGLLFGEGRYYHDLQVEATYTRQEELPEWTGFVPRCQAESLPVTSAILATAGELRICMTGDSISAGANASGVCDAPPGMPPYGELVALGLEQHSGASVSFTNLAVGGMGAEHGIEAAGQAALLRPDLTIIAYGMNDVGRRDPDGFRQRIVAGMEVIRAANPAAEFVLVASMLGNPEWVHTPTEMFSLYRDALRTLCGPGVVLADLTAMWTDLLRRKAYHDLTGNGVNHPNDFGHRVYAQVILALLLTGSPRSLSENPIRAAAGPGGR